MIRFFRAKATQFKRMYENGSIDFASVGSGSTQNYIMWRKRPSELDLKKWLPIFLEGIVEKEVYNCHSASSAVFFTPVMGCYTQSIVDP